MSFVILTLSEPHNPQSLYPIRLDPLATPIARKWLQQLKVDLDKASPMTLALGHLEKNYCFLGLPEGGRDLAFLCDQMNQNISRINQFIEKKQGPWAQLTPLTLNFNPQELQIKGQTLLNDLHHHFEQLIGQIWNHSSFFLTADSRTQFAIKQINQLCHEIEVLMRVEEKKLLPEEVAPTLHVSFLEAPIFPLDPEDYEHFTMERQFGLVYLHYCQLGKTHLEAFYDQDQVVGKENISGLRYYSSQFDIDLGPYTDPADVDMPWYQERQAQWNKWLNSHGVNHQDLSLGLGVLPVARMRASQFRTSKISEIHKIFRRYSNILKISVCSEGEVVERFYPYKWTDPGYMELQERLIFEHSQGPS